MEDNQFQELLKAVQNGEEDVSFIKATLSELLRTEFADIKEHKFKVTIKDLGHTTYAESMVLNGKAFLFIDPKSYPKLKEILRHELLHIELGGLGDESPIFKAEARRRGISIWCV